MAMRYASRGIIPPKEWEHDKFIKDIFDKTVS